MQTLNRHTQLFLLVLPILAFTVSCEESTIAEPDILFSYQNIEEQELASDTRFTDDLSGLDYTGWGVYEDIIFPGTTIEWSIDHEDFDGRSVLACAITGGDAYNNAFFTNTVAIEWEELSWPYASAKRFQYSLDFYIDGTFDCENPNLSTLEGIEFTFQHVVVPVSNGFGIQYSKAGEWRYWNDEKDSETGLPKAWQSFYPEILTCLPTKKWNSLELEGEVDGFGIRYTKMLLNGTEYDLSKALVGKAVIPETWVENFLQVGVQLNGDKAIETSHGEGVDPVKVYLDKVSLKGF